MPRRQPHWFLAVLPILWSTSVAAAPPTALLDSASPQEDTPIIIDVAMNDSDPDGDLLPFSAHWVDNPGLGPFFGTVTNNYDGTLTYTPELNYCGPDCFEYRICDAAGNCSTAMVAVVVLPVPDLPVAYPDYLETFAAGNTINVLDNDMDPDGVGLAPIIDTFPANGTVTPLFHLEIGLFDYSPNSGFVGTDTFTYTICHLGVNCTQTVTVLVKDFLSSPFANDDHQVFVGEDQPATIPVLDNDSNFGLNPVVTLFLNPAHGLAMAQPDGTIVYTPNLNFFGCDEFVYQLCGSNGECDWGRVHIEVTPSIDQPLLGDDMATTAEDSPVLINVVSNDSDPDGDGLNFDSMSVVTPPASGSLTSHGFGHFTYTPNPNFHGSDSFEYLLCNFGVSCDTATVSITVTPVHDPTVAVDDPVTTCQGVPVVIDVLANDTVDAVPPNPATVVSMPSGGSLVNHGDGTFTYTPNPTFSGSDNFMYEVCDGGMPTDCDQATANITVHPTPICTISNVMHNTCAWSGDGSATISVTNGTPPFTYAWSDGQASQTAMHLLAGNYTVTVTDANGCTCSESVTIIEPMTPACSITKTDPCYLMFNGTATVTPSCGTPPYTYDWSDGQTTQTAVGLGAGPVYVTVTDTNGLSICLETTMLEDAPPLTCMIDMQTNISCDGASDGSAQVVATGGAPPYSYAWDLGQSTQTATGLPEGTHGVTVTDANGCTCSTSVTLTEPDPLIVAILLVDHPSCNGLSDGEAGASAAGGTPPYTYLWDNGATTAMLSGLSAGSYGVTVTDANGCTGTNVATLANPPAMTCSATQVAAASCVAPTGSASAQGSGGVGPYSYMWNDGQTTQVATGLAAGTYTVTVTDADGCSCSTSVTISGASVPTCSITVGSHVSCSGGSDGWAYSTESGNGPFTYLWSNGSTSNTVSNVTSGTYSVTVTDINGCTCTDSVTITDPPPLIVTIGTTPASCPSADDGTAAANVSGGIPPYSYSWADGQTTPTAVGLAPLPVMVTVTDSNGCVSTANASVPTPPPPTNDATCSAIPLTFDVPQPYDTCLATVQPGEAHPGVGSGPVPCAAQDGWCPGAASIEQTLWYTFVAPPSGCVTIDAGPGNAQLAVWLPDLCDDFNTFGLVAANDDSQVPPSPNSPRIDHLVGLFPGVAYYVQLDGVAGVPEMGEIIITACDARVTDCLEILYDFQDPPGNTVADVSGQTPPIDLTISDPSAVQWLSGGGLRVNSAVFVKSALPATRFVEACKLSNEVTVEAWVSCATDLQGGPARIATCSLNGHPGGGNAVLGQEQMQFYQRCRTTTTDLYGLPNLASGDCVDPSMIQHVVYTRDVNSIEKIYVDGVLKGTDTRGGTFGGWGDYVISLANEPDYDLHGHDRPWRGDLHLVAFYKKALSESEVQINYSVGPNGSGSAPLPMPPSLTFKTRINCGGPEVSAGGYTWLEDSFVVGGLTAQTSAPIHLTTLDSIYQTERYGDCTYEIPVPLPGTYDIVLHFADIYWGAPGGGPAGSGLRIFDVDIEGAPALTGYDIWDDVGALTADIHTFPGVTINDGSATIELFTIVDNAKISAIEVCSSSLTPPTPSIELTSPSDGADVTAPFLVGFDVQNMPTYVSLSIDGSVVDATMSSSPFSVASLPVGPHTLTVTLLDSGGMPTSYSDSVVVNVVVAPPAPPFAERINCGGPAVFAGGNTWVADNYFSGGGTFSTMLPIDNTDLDLVHHYERFGNCTYEVPVPAPGVYTIVLHFSDIYWGVPGAGPGGPGLRVFHVDVEGAPALTNYDIWAAVGATTAVVHTFNGVVVNDGYASIEFVSVVDNAKISGIEVLGATAPPPPPVQTDIRINCGGPQVVVGGETFSADMYFSGGGTYSNNIPIENTTLDQIYTSERAGDCSYEIPVVNGTYEVTIHLADIYFGALNGGPGGPGLRIFDLDVEGQAGLTNYDLWVEVGPATAVTHTFFISVTDGSVSIGLTTIVDNAKISAIECGLSN